MSINGNRNIAPILRIDHKYSYKIQLELIDQKLQMNTVVEFYLK